jgi:hypothetical protein
MIHKMNEIVKLINRYGLTTPERNRELVYQRYYVYKELRKYKLSLKEIGRLFNRDHASVIHGIKVARMFEHMKDDIYLEYVKHIRADLMCIIENQSVFALRKIDYVQGTAIMYVNLPIDEEVYNSIDDMDLNQFRGLLECVNGV